MSDNLTTENKTRIIDIINDFFGGGLEDIIEEMPKLRAENEHLRAENERLRAGADLLDADERDAIALQALKSSYENIAYSYKASIDDEDRRYHQDMLDTLDGAIGIFSNLKQLEDWNSKKAGYLIK